MVLPVADVSKNESYFVRIRRKYRRYLSSKMPRGLKTVFIYLFAFLVLFVIIDISGVFRHPMERDYFTEFSYPLDVDNFPSVVERFRQGEPVAYDPINLNYSTLKYLNTAKNGCDIPLRLVVLIKSAPANFENREAIRATWGYPRRFSDVPIKTVFLLGQLSDPDMKIKTPHGEAISVESKLQLEIQKYSDIVRANFTDSYYNNTMKTMMGMRWAAELCSDFRFIFFVDDDMYVSIKNLLKFVRYPTHYPKYWEEQKQSYRQMSSNKEFSTVAKNTTNSNAQTSNSINLPLEKVSANDPKQIKTVSYQAGDKQKNSPFDFDIDLDKNAKLYAGYVFFVPPHRHKVGTKWFLPLSEYPFNYFPPYVPAGAIIMSKAAFLDIYYASFFTKHFRFDDIFVALCAKKMGIEPYHNNYFRFWPAPIKDPYEKDYEYVITSHGYHDPQELRTFWNVQKSLGHA